MPVDDLWYHSAKKGPDGKPLPTTRHGRGKRYRVRYVDPNGEPHQPLFHLKRDADAFDASVRADVARGEYIDPRGGRRTFRELAEEWRSNQPHRENSANTLESLFRRHVYPVIGDRPVAPIKRSHIQALIRRMEASLAPASIHVAYNFVSAVFAAAVMDGLIPASPCVKIVLPEVERKRLTPLPVDDVAALRAAKRPDFRALDDLGALAGLRQGEAFGLEVPHVNFLRRTLRVEQQLIWLPGGPPYLAPTKTKYSRRTIPIGQTLVDRLAAHLAEFPAHEVEIEDRTDTKVVTRVARLITTFAGTPVRRSEYSRLIWKPSALDVEGAPTFHDLRHFYASALIAKGASVVTVSARLGHAPNGTETLSTYAHLWPGEDDRTREAMDGLFNDQQPHLRSIG